jgi:transketolase
MFRAVHGSTVLYPSDANQTAKLVELAANNPGITYLRTTRADTPVIYAADASFSIGGSRLLSATPEDVVTVAAAGITVHEALKASELLAAEGIRLRVLDLYSVKPIDRQTLLESVSATGGPSSPSKTTGRKADSATPCSRHSPTPASPFTPSSSPSASFRAPAAPPSSCTPPASTPRRSSPPSTH